MFTPDARCPAWIPHAGEVLPVPSGRSVGFEPLTADTSLGIAETKDYGPGTP